MKMRIMEPVLYPMGPPGVRLNCLNLQPYGVVATHRADYYRELTHCRSLPENDEMLRILRAMQFLALLQ